MLVCASMHCIECVIIFWCFFFSVESETAIEINANTDQYNYIEEQGKRKPFDSFLIL
jgi:hypothetical protein